MLVIAMVDGRQPSATDDGMLAFGMPSALTRQETAAIAALANLELDADEIELFARQLGEILAYADQVQQIDTSGVPPTAGVVPRPAADRADDVRPSLERDDALASAPDAAIDAGLFRVPRVIG
jgi:aspartyl-tRNA(Asn)/glutamyl-tRNA(Gln) amidotransferase subunit C